MFWISMSDMNKNVIRLDTKVQMMDAGMALFRSNLSFGQAMGQVKAEMQEYGKVYTAAELTDTAVPESTGEFDLFLCRSTVWRTRYISARVESAGKGRSEDAGEVAQRYAVTLREGNRSTPLRGAVMTLGIAALVLCIFLTGSILISVLDIILIGCVCFRWITPSHQARKVVRDLLHSIDLAADIPAR